MKFLTKGERKITNQELKKAIDEPRNVSDLIKLYEGLKH